MTQLGAHIAATLPTSAPESRPYDNRYSVHDHDVGKGEASAIANRSANWRSVSSAKDIDGRARHFRASPTMAPPIAETPKDGKLRAERERGWRVSYAQPTHAKRRDDNRRRERREERTADLEKIARPHTNRPPRRRATACLAPQRQHILATECPDQPDAAGRDPAICRCNDSDVANRSFKARRASARRPLAE